MPRPLVERPVAHDDVGRPGRDGHGRLLDAPTAGASAVVDPAEETEARNAKVPGNLDLRIRIRGEGDHAVDILWSESGIGDGRGHCLHSKSHLTSTRLLGELGGTDAGDGSFVLEPVGSVATHGRLTVTVPVT